MKPLEFIRVMLVMPLVFAVILFYLLMFPILWIHESYLRKSFKKGFIALATGKFYDDKW